MDSATIINLVIQLVAGAAGGNGLAKAAHSLNLGTTGNTIAGAIGGLAGGTWLGPAIAAMAAAKTQIAPRGQRIPWLGWTAFFLLFIGAAVLAFAYIVAPIEAGASGLRLEHATRARPVYLAGLTLLGGGAFFLLAWLSRRRPPGD
ncbi:hypothetical protein WLV51_23535 [Bordetella bronchiseptica]